MCRCRPSRRWAAAARVACWPRCRICVHEQPDSGRRSAGAARVSAPGRSAVPFRRAARGRMRCEPQRHREGDRGIARSGRHGAHGVASRLSAAECHGDVGGIPYPRGTACRRSRPPASRDHRLVDRLDQCGSARADRSADGSLRFPGGGISERRSRPTHAQLDRAARRCDLPFFELELRQPAGRDWRAEPCRGRLCAARIRTLRHRTASN